MTMTPRKKAKQASTGGENNANVTKKREKTKDNTSLQTASPPNVRRSQRRSLVHTSPSQDTCESTSKKVRQAGPSPETPSRVSPRGKRESSSPIPSRTSPRRTRSSLKDSTDASASNVGSATVNCASTPVRGRTRRESNSSSVSGASDTPSVTPTTPQRGRGSKRKLPDKPDLEFSEKANGPSPQYSPNTKRRGRCQVEISPSTTNGKSEGQLRPRRKICTPSPKHEVLDGGVDKEEACVADGENSSVKNSVGSTKKLENKGLKVKENGNDASTGMRDGPYLLGSASTTGDGADPNVNVNSKDCNQLLEMESSKDSKDRLDLFSPGESQNLPSGDTEPRTCSSSPLHEKSCTATHSCKAVISSSHIKSAKRKHSSSESTICEIPEHTQASKKTKQCESVPDGSGGVKCEYGTMDSEATIQGKELKADSSDLLDSIDMETKVNIVGVNIVVKRLLDTFGLTDEQSQEVCSLLATDVTSLLENKIIEELVETLLNKSTSVRTMNAPRFNKFLRQLLNHYCCLDTTKESKHDLCEKAVQWARDRKSVNLRHELELTLMSLYYNTSQYKKAEGIANGLYNETKKLQDKEKTVKACLCLSQTYHAMGNISKARANITTAKTEALKIYTPPDMQGELDLQSGIMQVAEGKDMETAYSYFKEAATGFVSHKQRARALKYMLLSKIMMNRSEEGEKAVRSQSHVQDIDEGVEAMLAIAGAAHKSSLMEFRKLREVHKKHLAGDILVAGILDDLYTTMMEKNLLNIVLPFERIQIGHIAEKIGLPREEVERRISQMILDKRINAQLDHRDDCLYVYASVDSDVVYQTGIKTLTQLDKTISHLNRKVKKLL